MSRRRMALAPAAALLALVLLAAGCGGNDAERAGTQAIPGTQLSIYTSMPHRGVLGEPGLALERGAALALAERRGRVGRYRITLRSLDSGEGDDESRSRSNGRRAVQDTRSVGYIGELDSQVSKITVPQMNSQGVAHIGPTNTYTGLTSDGPGAEPGEPDRYYPTGVRTFARLVPNDELQGEALGLAVREAGCRRLRVWRSNSPFGRGIAETASSAADEAGIELAGTEEIKPQQPSYARQAEEVDADCLLWTGEPERSGVQILGDAAEANPALKLFAASEHCDPEGADVPRLVCTHPVVEPRSGRGREVLDRYRERFGDGGPADAYAVYGYEAMAVLLAALEKAAGEGEVSRASVAEALYALGPRDGAIGRYEIDSDGDVDLRGFGLYRLEGGELRLEKVVRAGG